MKASPSDAQPLSEYSTPQLRNILAMLRHHDDPSLEQHVWMADIIKELKRRDLK